jgi:hypothetical protein
MRAGVSQGPAQPFRFRCREWAGADQFLEPAHEIGSGAHELQPCAVGVEVREREPVQTGVLQSFDVVFEVSMLTDVMVEFDRVGGGVGVMTPLPVLQRREQ